MTTKRLPRHPAYQEAEDDLSIEYPDSDGEPMAENDAQLTAMMDTISSLRQWYSDREDVYAGGDMLIYYKINDNETRVAPDVFVVFGVESRHKRNSWIVWREGKAPDIVMELASGSTWRRDMREKRDIYAEMGVIEYWRFDPTSNYFFPPLAGERLGDGEYTTIELTTNRDGLVWGHSSVLGLDVWAFPDGNMRFYDPVSEQWLRTFSEEAEARRSAETALRTTEMALQEEASARQAAEAEVERLREQLSSLQSGE
jgi:Uma2 family endonuclease